MAKEFSKAFYKSRTWQKVRQFVWKRDNGLCQDCLRKGLITPGKEVHHIVELTEDNIGDASISLGADNLITLCKSCHETRHNVSNKCRRYSVNADGSVETLPPMHFKNSVT
nr:MAG TPA: HNH endonuclease [Caudoviricetes sp.]